MTPYADNLEYLLDELFRIDRLIYIYLERVRADLSGHMDEFMGLYISEEEVQKLQKSPGLGGGPSIQSDPRMEEIEDMRRDINNRKLESLKNGRELRLHTLSELFSLDTFEIDVLLFGLAPELELKYEKLYSYLQNDVTKKRLGVDLALNLLCPTIEAKLKSRAYFSPAAPLLKNHLIYLAGKEANGYSEGQQSLISTFIKVDERIIDFLLGFDELDPRIRDFSDLLETKRSFEALILPEDLKNRLKDSVNWHILNRVPLKLLFKGPYGSGKKISAEAACRENGTDMLIVDSKILLKNRSPEIASLVLREALLQGSALYFEEFDALLAENEAKPYLKNLLYKLKTHPNCVFLAGAGFSEKKEGLKEDLMDGLINYGFLPFSFPNPTYPLRKKLWEICLEGNYSLAEDMDFNEGLKGLASTFRFTGGQIKDAINIAGEIAKAENPEFPILSAETLYKGCKARSNQRLGTLALKISPQYHWEDIVLLGDTLEQLKEVRSFIKHREKVYSDWGFEKKLSYGKGLNVLFSGPSGTGKTMAAEILANEVKLDLYKIDLSSVVSKYIGETEKNLKKIFEEAETSNCILFFDEADAIFGKRSEVKDAHDRYANIETAYLLQKMEEHEGTVILASNFRKNIDESFERRLNIIIEFPFPDENRRLKIWRTVFPREATICDDVDYDILAREVKLSGGHIKNIALAAAFYAAEDEGAIRMTHIIQAGRREYHKLGRTWNEFHDSKKVFSE
ncbi:AAA family ATPase [Methanosarcina sp.]|uniref:AAA family ATPase n=1 Tax=Methanosarcina sp. TaxID=2213 RepID=UPI003BB76D76